MQRCSCTITAIVAVTLNSIKIYPFSLEINSLANVDKCRWGSEKVATNGSSSRKVELFRLSSVEWDRAALKINRQKAAAKSWTGIKIRGTVDVEREESRVALKHWKSWKAISRCPHCGVRIGERKKARSGHTVSSQSCRGKEQWRIYNEDRRNNTRKTLPGGNPAFLRGTK